VTWTPPTVTAQVAPGFHPRNLPGPGDWVDLPGTLSWSRTVGKQDTLADYTAGRATLVLDNGALDLDQLVPGSVIEGADGLPSTPVRLKITHGGVTKYRDGWYTVDGWNPVGRRWAARVAVELTDWMGWAASQRLPSSRWESWVTRERPIRYWRGDISSNPSNSIDDRVYSMAQRWTGAFGDLIYNDAVYTDGQITEASSISGGSGKAMRFNSFSTWAGADADVIESITDTGTWMVCFWMKAEAAAYGKQYIGIEGGANEWFIGTDAFGQIVATVTVNGDVYSGTITADHCDGQPHLIALRVVTTGGLRVMNIASDLGTASTSTMATASHTSGGGAIVVHADQGTEISDVCYWDSWPTCQDGTTSMVLEDFCYQWVNGTDELGHQDLETMADRLTALGLYGLVDLPTTDVTLDAPGAYYETYVPSDNLAAGIRALASASLGDVYTLSDGTLRIRDGLFSSSDPDDYDTVHALLTDDPAATGPPLVIRTTRQRSGSRADRIVNDVRVDGVCYFFDLDSQDRYGVKNKTYSGEQLVNTSAVKSMAQAVLAANKDPQPEIGEVGFRVWGDDDRAAWVLSTLELEKRVTYREATPDNAVEVLNEDVRIIGFTETIQNGVDWNISALRLAPV